MEADSYYNMVGLVENMRVSLSDAYYQDRFVAHIQNATVIE